MMGIYFFSHPTKATAIGAPAIYAQDDNFKAQIVDATHGNLTDALLTLLTLESNILWPHGDMR